MDPAMPSVIVNHASLNYRIVNLVHPLSILYRGPVDDFQPVSALPLLRWYAGTGPCLLQFRDTSINKLQAKTSVYTNCDCNVWHTSTLLRLATVQSSLSILIQYCHATVYSSTVIGPTLCRQLPTAAISSDHSPLTTLSFGCKHAPFGHVMSVSPTSPVLQLHKCKQKMERLVAALHQGSAHTNFLSRKRCHTQAL